MQPHYCWVEGRRIISSDLLAILWLIFEHPYNKSSRKLLRMTTSSLAWRQFNLIFNQHLNMLFSWCYFLSTLNFTFFFLCITPPPKKKIKFVLPTATLLFFFYFPVGWTTQMLLKIFNIHFRELESLYCVRSEWTMVTWGIQ